MSTYLAKVVSETTDIRADKAIPSEAPPACGRHEDAWAKALRLRQPAKGWEIGPDGEWKEAVR